MILDHDSKLIILGSAGFIDEEVSKIHSSLEDADETVWFGDEINLSDFFSFSSSPSIFHSAKIAVVHNADKVKELATFMQQAQKCFETVIVLTADVGSEKKFEKFEGFRFIVEKKKTRQEAVRQIKDIFEQSSLPCDQSCAEEIFDIFAGDVKQIKSEVDKLYIYYSHAKPASQEDILKLITAEKQENIFNFIDSFASRDKKSAVKILDSLIKCGETLPVLFVMLGRRMKQVYIQKKIPSALQERMFIVNKIKSNATRWKPSELSHIAGEFAELDYKIKTGQIRDSDAVYHLLSLM